jgi:hypothetical protein
MAAACDLSDDQTLAAVAAKATAAGAAALLSSGRERAVTTEDMGQRVASSSRLRRMAAFCAELQTRSGATGATSAVDWLRSARYESGGHARHL